jgi:hypothetical protein
MDSASQIATAVVVIIAIGGIARITVAISVPVVRACGQRADSKSSDERRTAPTPTATPAMA